jgi:hypothetical protein
MGERRDGGNIVTEHLIWCEANPHSGPHTGIISSTTYRSTSCSFTLPAPLRR